LNWLLVNLGVISVVDCVDCLTGEYLIV